MKKRKYGYSILPDCTRTRGGLHSFLNRSGVALLQRMVWRWRTITGWGEYVIGGETLLLQCSKALHSLSDT